MFNNTCKVVGHVSDQNVGVLLPHSTNILTFDEIDKKIIKTKKHIEYLSNQLPLNNRGGKAFRAKKVSITQQISLSTSRLKLLEQAKAVVLDPMEIIKSSTHVILNNTPEIVICVSYLHDLRPRFGVLLPHSGKILAPNDIDEIFLKTTKYIDYLFIQLPSNRKSDTFFEKIDYMQKVITRLELLGKAKAIVLNPLKITKPSAPVQERRQPIMFETAEDASLFAMQYFAEIIREGIQSYPIYDGKHREILERTVNHLCLRDTFLVSRE